VIVTGDQREAVRDRPQSGGLRSRADLIGKVGAANDPCERMERRITRMVLVNQGLERATPYVVDVGIGGPRRIEAPCPLAVLDLRDLVRLDEDEGGRGVDEPTNEPGRGGPVHADIPARHPLHVSPSLPCARRALDRVERLDRSAAIVLMTPSIPPHATT